MKSPATKDLKELKRVGRCLRGRPVGDIVFEPQTLPVVFGGVLRRRPCWRLGNAQNPLWNGSHVWIALDQAWERGAQHHSTDQWGV